jgi:hypothetical protein
MAATMISANVGSQERVGFEPTSYRSMRVDTSQGTL